MFICIIAAGTQVGLAFVYQAISKSVLEGNLQRFIRLCFFVLLYLLFDALMDYLPRLTRARLVQSVTMDLRNKLVENVESTSIKDMNQIESTFFIARLINELEVVEKGYLNPLARIFLSVFVFVFSLISALTLQNSFTLIVVVLSIFPLAALFLAKRILSGKKSNMLDKQKRFLEKYEELVYKFLTLRIFNSFPFINRRLFSLNDRLRDSKVDYASAQGKTYGVSYALGNIVYTGTWIVGGIYVITSSLTFPELIAMTQLMSMIAGPIQYFTDSFPELVSRKNC
ncbi:ABC transporter transmembrane domain-containing protein [Vagococcus entomophilus]|uniref:ABC transporter ATP-binding protein n=1 Tax=Vagococcus entomophilus TaxID=1160095 RepID=UPI001475726B|nr:ABC transporter ATP-binding protein [Vagococcus entomophilus]